MGGPPSRETSRAHLLACTLGQVLLGVTVISHVLGCTGCTGSSPCCAMQFFIPVPQAAFIIRSI
eukprot:6963218-Ditylum_brightwellii.AAC.1